MISKWPADARGSTQEGGVHLHHAFSSGSYHDPNRMGFGALRVLDSGRLAATTEMPVERRANMDILTYLVDGAARMQVGNQGHAMHRGDMFWLGAGSGIDQSLANVGDSPCSFVQLWLQPMRVNAGPRFALHRSRKAKSRHGCWLVASSVADAAADGVLPLRADAHVYVARLGRGEALHHAVPAGRRLWIQSLRGAVMIDGVPVAAGDGLAISDQQRVEIKAAGDSELLLIELA